MFVARTSHPRICEAAADSDEVARAFRDDLAQCSEMMSPRCDASLADNFLAFDCVAVNRRREA